MRAPIIDISRYRAAEQRFSPEQEKLIRRLKRIIDLLGRAEEQKSSQGSDWNKQLVQLFKDVSDAVVHLENGMSALPPGLTVEELEIRADDLSALLAERK